MSNNINTESADMYSRRQIKGNDAFLCNSTFKQLWIVLIDKLCKLTHLLWRCCIYYKTMQLMRTTAVNCQALNFLQNVLPLLVLCRCDLVPWNHHPFLLTKWHFQSSYWYHSLHHLQKLYCPHLWRQQPWDLDQIL